MYRIRLKSNAKAAFFVVLAILLFMSSTQAQDSNSEPWTFHSEQNGVKVYYKVSKCSAVSSTDPMDIVNGSKKMTVFLKFENQEAEAKTISWKSELNTENTALLSTNLMATSSVETTCENSSTFELRAGSNGTNPISTKDALNLLSINISTN